MNGNSNETQVPQPSPSPTTAPSDPIQSSAVVNGNSDETQVPQPSPSPSPSTAPSDPIQSSAVMNGNSDETQVPQPSPSPSPTTAPSDPIQSSTVMNGNSDETQVPQPSPSPSPSPTTAPQSDHMNTEKWGTHIMGPPAAPSSHPNNQKAALWKAEEKEKEEEHHQPQNPYVQHSPVEKTSNNPIEPVNVFNSWSRKTESLARNIWQNLKTGPSVSEAVYGKVGLTTKVLTGGGFESLYKQTFATDPNDKLKKTFACYLSTLTGPVAGTLYLSNIHVAFCSDRPLSFTAPSGEQAWSYYKVMIPLAKISSINPISMKQDPPGPEMKQDPPGMKQDPPGPEMKQDPPGMKQDTPGPEMKQDPPEMKQDPPEIKQDPPEMKQDSPEKKQHPPEKYIQIATIGNHDSWFMGFVNYDKASLHLSQSFSEFVATAAQPVHDSPVIR